MIHLSNNSACTPHLAPSPSEDELEPLGDLAYLRGDFGLKGVAAMAYCTLPDPTGPPSILNDYFDAHFMNRLRMFDEEGLP